MIRPAVILILLVAVILAADDELIVKIKNGLLRGTYMKSRNGRRFLGFMGIRYANPPLGKLRFQPPVPINDWDGIKNATEIHDMCIQRDFPTGEKYVKGSEDCLFLNVYTPKIDKKQLLPVMMYIHGGAFYSGSGNKLRLNPEILLDKDIVLVIINYRLGPMGFLSTGDHVVPGNMGLKDQSFALKWIKENIEQFGGDPNAVTIFGNSSGATCTHLHIFSPLSKGLFHGAISQSGTAATRSSIQTQKAGIQFGRKMANICNCSIATTKGMIECLQKVDAKDLINAQAEYLMWDIDPYIIFGPIIEPKGDSSFIPDTIENILKHGIGSDVPWITGIHTEEGLMRSADIFTHPSKLKELNERFDEIVPIILSQEKNNKTVSFIRNIKAFYLGKNDITYSDIGSFTNMLTDIVFGVGVSNAINLHMKYLRQPVYNYLLAYRGSFSFTKKLCGLDNYFGVCHADELFYFFPLYKHLFPGKLPSADDLKMSETLLNMWTNFATHRNPTPDFSKLVWSAVESNAHEYLRINNYRNMTMEKNLFKERMDFLKSLEHFDGSTHEQIKNSL